MMELRLVLAVLASEFEFELLSDPDPAVSVGATRRPKESVRLGFHRR
jgi:cytochrome P450